MKNTDATFLKNFSLLVAGLAVFAVILIIVAWNANASFYGGSSNASNSGIAEERAAGRKAEADARIAPAAVVFHGDAGRQALIAAAEAAKSAAAQQVAYGGTLDGAVIYDALCGACHKTGAGGAPAPNAEAWAPRIAQGIDTLVKRAIEGFQGQAGLMPARGGNPALTDEQVRATVEYMVAKYSK
jgi:cytochrome c5